MENRYEKWIFVVNWCELQFFCSIWCQFLITLKSPLLMHVSTSEEFCENCVSLSWRRKGRDKIRISDLADPLMTNYWISAGQSCRCASSGTVGLALQSGLILIVSWSALVLGVICIMTFSWRDFIVLLHSTPTVYALLLLPFSRLFW